MYSVIWQLVYLKHSLAEKALGTDDSARVFSTHLKQDGDDKGAIQQLLSIANDRNIVAHRPGVWLVLLAGILGVLTFAGLMQTTVGKPVNLLYLLLVFGPLQWALMVFALVGVARDHVPLIQPLLTKGLGKFVVPHRMQGSFFFHLNQSLSLTFIITACITFVVMLAFRDMSFGWETTFQWDSSALASILGALATPWATLWPEAVPSAEWVSQTRFYRMASPTLTVDLAGHFGQWWPFIAAYMITYSLIPRTVLWGIGHFLLSRKMARWIATDPELQQALRQLGEHEKKLTISGSPADSHRTMVDLAQVSDGEAMSIPSADVTFYWKVIAPKDSPVAPVQLGLPGHWTQDKMALDQHGAKDVWNLVVPGWEAPTAELSDLLSPLQERHSIRLVLKTLARPLSKGQRMSWEQFRNEQLPHTEIIVWAEES